MFTSNNRGKGWIDRINLKSKKSSKPKRLQNILSMTKSVSQNLGAAGVPAAAYRCSQAKARVSQPEF
jgi:hypothetical protein